MVQRFGFSAARSVHSYIRDNCDRLFICTTAAASYSAASTQPQMIVSATVTADEWSFSSGAQGPALTFNSRTLTIEGSGSASHLVFARSSGSTILALTDVCAGTVFSSGNTVTIPAWRTEIVGGDHFLAAAPQMVPNVGAPGMFSPPNQNDLIAWYAPESTVAVTAGRVSQWNDKSGRGNHVAQVSASKMPTHASAAVNGLNALTFTPAGASILWDRSADWATINATDHAFSVVAVQRTASASASQVSLAFSTTAADNSFTGISVVNAGYRLFRNDTGGVDVTRTFSSFTSAWAVHLCNYFGTTFEYHINGVTVTAGSFDVNAFTSANTFSIGGLILASFNPAGTSFLDGQIAEVLVYATAMTSSNARELDKLLGAKYAITIT
jgi:hypothetical protein